MYDYRNESYDALQEFLNEYCLEEANWAFTEAFEQN